MKYPKIFKEMALKTPILGGIVSERDRLRQKILIDLGASISGINQGYCSCCRSDTIFQINGDWLRDQYVCTNCFSIPRQRHVQYVLDNYFPGWERMSVHESSPSNDLISRYCGDYSSSQYLEGFEFGQFSNGIRCENLESLTFPDESFDVFITQDVFEHIFHPARAAIEIMRVLKPGGVHVFTVPKYNRLEFSYPRATIVDAKVEHLKEESYHGSPVGNGKSLVTWDYGRDFEYLINKWSKAFTTTYVTRDRSFGLDGEHIEVFVTKK